MNEYGAALEAAAAAGSIVADVSRLPAPKDQVKNAILYALRITSDEKMLQHLKTGFIDLAIFQAGRLVAYWSRESRISLLAHE